MDIYESSYDIENFLDHYGVKGMKWGVHTREVVEKAYLGRKLAHKIIKSSKKMYAKNYVKTPREKSGHDETDKLLFVIGGKSVSWAVGNITSPAFS